MRKIIYFIVIASILTSCKKEVNVNEPKLLDKAQRAVFIEQMTRGHKKNVPVRSVVQPLDVIPEVVIGKQTWMGKNLDVSKYRNGDVIPQVKDATEWDNSTTGAWCYYENSSELGTVYGKLYNYYAIHDPRGLAPNGWHISSGIEWAQTFLYLDSIGGNPYPQLKETGNTHWIVSVDAIGATNSSGFTALPGGFRFLYNGVSFYNLGYDADFWTSDIIPDGADWTFI